jgi:hypothetical protein
MRAARYGAFWQLAENFLFGRFLRTTQIVAGRRSDNENVSCDRATILELLTLYLHFVVMQQTNLPARPLLNRSLEGRRLVVIGGTSAFGMATAKAAKVIISQSPPANHWIWVSCGFERP